MSLLYPLSSTMGSDIQTYQKFRHITAGSHVYVASHVLCLDDFTSSILRAAMVLGKAMDLSPLRLRQPYNAR